MKQKSFLCKSWLTKPLIYKPFLYMLLLLTLGLGLPIASLSQTYTQNWDASTSFPAGWAVPAGASSPSIGSPGLVYSSPNCLKDDPGCELQFSTYQPANGDITVIVYNEAFEIKFRWHDANNYLYAIAASSATTVDFHKVVSGTDTLIGTVTTGFVNPGGVYNGVEINYTGSALKCRMFTAGSTPGAYPTGLTDSSNLTGGKINFTAASGSQYFDDTTIVDNDVSESIAASPTSVNTTTTATISLVGTGTAWTSGTTFTVTGATKNSQTFTDATHASVSITTTGTAGANNITISDGTASTTISTVTPSALTGGVAGLTASTATSVSLTSTDATGGSTPYTYQWQQSTNGSFSSPTSVSGATSLTATVSGLTSGNTYWFRLKYTDSASTVTYSTPVMATLNATLALGAIGDSTWYVTSNNFEGTGGAYSVPTAAGMYLSQMLYPQNITVDDEAQTGATTGNWMPSGTYITNAYSDFAAAGVTYVLACLGANNAFQGGAASSYQSDMQAITDDIVAHGYKVILCYPMSMVNPTAANLIGSYQAALDAIVAGEATTHPGMVFAGDHSFVTYSQSHMTGSYPSNVTFDGTHPVDVAILNWGQDVAKAVINIISPPAGSATGYIGRGRKLQ